METLPIYKVMNCNKVLLKLMEQNKTFPFSLGFKIYKIIKKFDEVEEYVFSTIDLAFGEYDWMNMTKEQSEFYSRLLMEQIELDFEKIPSECLANNSELMLTLEDINDLSIILS